MSTEKKYPKPRVDKSFDDLLTRWSKQTGLSKTKITKQMADEFQEKEFGMKNFKKTKKGFRFDFKI